MTACHILLGRPWQHDRKIIHNGFTNVYTINHEGKLKDLLPLPPHRAIPPPKQKKVVQPMARKEYRREIEKEGVVLILFSKEVQHMTST